MRAGSLNTRVAKEQTCPPAPSGANSCEYYVSYSGVQSYEPRLSGGIITGSIDQHTTSGARLSIPWCQF